MFSADQCRLKAEELERIARVLTMRSERDQYLDLARHWRGLQSALEDAAGRGVSPKT